MSGRSTASNIKHLKERMESTWGCKASEPWAGLGCSQGIQGEREESPMSCPALAPPRVRCPHCGFGLLNGQEAPSSHKKFGMQDSRIGSSTLSCQRWMSHKGKKIRVTLVVSPSPAARENQLGQGGFPLGMSGFPKSTLSHSRTHQGCYTITICKQGDPCSGSGTCIPC